MIEIKLKRDFAVIRETLERIGIANRKTQVLTPSCYIIIKDQKYFIAHFKELLSNNDKIIIPQKDINRLHAICSMLQNWESISIVNEKNVYQKNLLEKIFVLPHSEKKNYKINHKVRNK